VRGILASSLRAGQQMRHPTEQLGALARLCVSLAQPLPGYQMLAAISTSLSVTKRERILNTLMNWRSCEERCGKEKKSKTALT
jgi:hypothetical protein